MGAFEGATFVATTEAFEGATFVATMGASKASKACISTNVFGPTD